MFSIIISYNSQEVYAFVGSQQPVNPRHYRLLCSDLPRPRPLPRTGTLTASGLSGFVMIIVENIKVWWFETH